MDDELAKVSSMYNFQLTSLENRVKSLGTESIYRLIGMARTTFLIETIRNPAEDCTELVTLPMIVNHLDYESICMNISWAPETAARLTFGYNCIPRTPEAFIEKLMRYMEKNPNDAFSFANLIYPSICGYFVVQEQLRVGAKLLQITFSKGYSVVAGLMFSAFFNGAPYFLKAVFVTLFKLLENHVTGFHLGTLTSLLAASLEHAAKYLLPEHQMIISDAIERFGDTDFLTDFFIKRVLMNGFKRYNRYDRKLVCPVAETKVLMCFEQITNQPLMLQRATMAKYFASQLLKTNVSCVSLPTINPNTNSSIVLGSVLEFRLFSKIMGWERAFSFKSHEDSFGTFAVKIVVKEEARPSTDVRLFRDFRDIKDVDGVKQSYMKLDAHAETTGVLCSNILDMRNRSTDVVMARSRVPDDIIKDSVVVATKMCYDNLKGFEEVIDVELSNRRILMQGSIWKEYYLMHLHEIVHVIMHNSSFNKDTFDDMAAAYIQNYKSVCLYPFIMIGLIEMVQRNEQYSKIIHEYSLIESMRILRNELLPSVDALVERLEGRRRAELDKLVDRIAKSYASSMSSLCFELCEVISAATQIASSVSPEVDIIDVAKYIYVKSNSNMILPVIICYFRAFFTSQVFLQYWYLEHKEEHQMMEIMRTVIFDIVGVKSELGVIISEFCDAR